MSTGFLGLERLARPSSPIAGSTRAVFLTSDNTKSSNSGFPEDSKSVTSKLPLASMLNRSMSLLFIRSRRNFAGGVMVGTEMRAARAWADFGLGASLGLGGNSRGTGGLGWAATGLGATGSGGAAGSGVPKLWLWPPTVPSPTPTSEEVEELCWVGGFQSTTPVRAPAEAEGALRTATVERVEVLLVLVSLFREEAGLALGAGLAGLVTGPRLG